MIARHLTHENHAEVLSAARRRSKVEIEALVARLAPRPDAPPVIRRLAEPAAPSARAATVPVPSTRPTAEPSRPAPVSPPPVIRASAPARFLVQLTVGQETHDRFRRLQALCARECRGGDPVAVFDLACRVLEERALKEKRAATKRSAVRPATSNPSRANGRHIPADVNRAVWRRDGHCCAFVGPAGRCTETKYLELHHRIPWALGGPSTTDNLSVRCRLHNVYEAEQVFGLRPAPSPEADRTPRGVPLSP
jgi:5-methylcytosine-specific restriction endonuclease McrA